VVSVCAPPGTSFSRISLHGEKTGIASPATAAACATSRPHGAQHHTGIPPSIRTPCVVCLVFSRPCPPTYFRFAALADRVHRRTFFVCGGGQGQDLCRRILRPPQLSTHCSDPFQRRLMPARSAYSCLARCACSVHRVPAAHSRFSAAAGSCTNTTHTSLTRIQPAAVARPSSDRARLDRALSARRLAWDRAHHLRPAVSLRRQGYLRPIFLRHARSVFAFGLEVCGVGRARLKRRSSGMSMTRTVKREGRATRS
jgi:hypothetical protein